MAQEDPTIDPNAPEWEPSFEPRSPRKYRWEPLAEDQAALPTGLQVRTIGLGVSVQDRFLNEFERRTGHSTSGKVTTLTAMITEWLAGGAQNYDTNETNANRNAALWDTGLLQADPGRQGHPLEVRPRHLHQQGGPRLRPGQRLSADRGLGRSREPDRVQAGAAVLQLRLDRLSLRSHRRGHHQLGRAPRREVRGQGRHPQRQPADPRLGGRLSRRPQGRWRSRAPTT